MPLTAKLLNCADSVFDASVNIAACGGLASLAPLVKHASHDRAVLLDAALINMRALRGFASLPLAV